MIVEPAGQTTSAFVASNQGPAPDEADTLRLAGTALLLVRALDHATRPAAGASGPSLTEINVLGRIARGDDTPGQLARRLRLDPARVTHLTDRLVADGLIARAVDPSDRRRWRLSLTTEGTSRLAHGRAAIRAALANLFRGLSDAEQVALVTGLAGVRRVLDGDGPEVSSPAEG